MEWQQAASNGNNINNIIINALHCQVSTASSDPVPVSLQSSHSYIHKQKLNELQQWF